MVEAGSAIPGAEALARGNKRGTADPNAIAIKVVALLRRSGLGLKDHGAAEGQRCCHQGFHGQTHGVPPELLVCLTTAWKPWMFRFCLSEGPDIGSGNSPRFRPGATALRHRPR